METKVDRPGAFQLGGVNLVSYASFDGDGTPKRLDIRNLIVDDCMVVILFPNGSPRIKN